MIKKIFVLFLAVITIMLSSVSGAVFAEENEPEVYGKAAILMDMDTGRILFGKNIDEKIYPASTTKIMTATLILECAEMILVKQLLQAILLIRL